MDASHFVMFVGERVEPDPHGPAASKRQGGRASSSRVNRKVQPGEKTVCVIFSRTETEGLQTATSGPARRRCSARSGKRARGWRASGC